MEKLFSLVIQNVGFMMPSSQQKIDIQQTATMLLGELIRFATLPGEPVPIIDGAQSAIEWLSKREYIRRYGGGFIATVEGREYYRGAQLKPDIGISADVPAWKDEALTGIIETTSEVSGYRVSRESNITNALLPKNKRNRENRDPEQVLTYKQWEAKANKIIAKRLGITVAKLKRFLKQGRVKVCKGIGQGEHFGRFNRNGKGLRNLCAKCEKEQRRKK